jgi:hypothetical protein
MHMPPGKFFTMFHFLVWYKSTKAQWLHETGIKVRDFIRVGRLDVGVPTREGVFLISCQHNVTWPLWCGDILNPVRQPGAWARTLERSLACILSSPPTPHQRGHVTFVIHETGIKVRDFIRVGRLDVGVPTRENTPSLVGTPTSSRPTLMKSRTLMPVS